ncbi:unnamed protein product [Pleuronectes platessa]|uniref:Uncharacterized protein n=1 Tax=Pleuronectes platessa TaxID=8262 RepID=A0A9N7USB6_PLEPL|nr:unnamed protein product [Pleuronectes platessa]
MWSHVLDIVFRRPRPTPEPNVSTLIRDSLPLLPSFPTLARLYPFWKLRSRYGAVKKTSRYFGFACSHWSKAWNNAGDRSLRDMPYLSLYLCVVPVEHQALNPSRGGNGSSQSDAKPDGCPAKFNHRSVGEEEDKHPANMATFPVIGELI